MSGSDISTPIRPVDRRTADRDGFARLLDKIVDQIDDLTHLEVVTILGQADAAKLFDKVKETAGGVDNAKVIYSRIGLVDGDIITIVDERFVAQDDVPKLRDFHQERVKEGGAIVQKNIQALKELLDLLRANRPPRQT